ncbi:MAG: glutamate ligase domain-containing protein, partial [Chloroflexota bacterium]
IKSGVHAVTAATGEALEVIEDRAASVRAPLLVVPRDVSARIVDESLLETRLELVSGALSLPVRLPMPGAFQATNAATAAAVVRSLRARGVDIPSSAIECGLGQTSFGGRLEVVQLEPLIVIDGAHHPDAIRVLMESLRRLVHGSGIVLLFAAQADKDADRMARMLGPGIETVIVTRVPGSERSASAAKLAQALEEVAGEVIAVEGYVEALKLARSRLSRNCMLLVTGSLYLAGAVRQLLRPKA